MGRNPHGGPVSPWPCRTRCPMRSCALILATLAFGLVVTVASLVAADALDPPGLLVVSLPLAISAVVLFSLRGLVPLTVALGCATLVAVRSQARGATCFVAAQQQPCEGENIVRGRQVLGVESKLSRHILGSNRSRLDVQQASFTIRELNRNRTGAVFWAGRRRPRSRRRQSDGDSAEGNRTERLTWPGSTQDSWTACACRQARISIRSEPRSCTHTLRAQMKVQAIGPRS